MSSQKLLVDGKGAAFGRLASRILETLNEAVAKRREEGATLVSLSEKIGCHRSSLTRTLNGSAANLTVRTISDILWATDFEAEDFKADPIEEINANWHESNDLSVISQSENVTNVFYQMHFVKMDLDASIDQFNASVFMVPQIETVIR